MKLYASKILNRKATVEGSLYFIEEEPNEWYYFLKLIYDDYSRMYGQHNKYGPFNTYAEALEDYNKKHPNVGVWDIKPHKDSPDKSWEVEEDEIWV